MKQYSSTSYEGLRVRGRIKVTISCGQVIYRDGRFTGRKGRGQFVARRGVDEEQVNE